MAHSKETSRGTLPGQSGLLAEGPGREGAETAADWLDRASGSFKDDPGFDEFLEYCRRFRQADRVSAAEKSF